MTSKQSWTVALTIAFTFVIGYGAAVFWKTRALETQRKAYVDNVMAASKLPSRVGKPLPAPHFFDVGGKPVPDEAWRKGKVVLVLLTTGCDSCRLEGAFLRTIVASRRDVRFLGVLSFEQDEQSLVAAQTIFPFPVVRDDRMELMRALGVSAVPIKIYLEDGVVKQSWGGASMDEQARNDFKEWLKRA
jgi:hypothetical protein